MRKVAVVTGANKGNVVYIFSSTSNFKIVGIIISMLIVFLGIGLCIVRNLCKHFEELASSNGLENDGVVYLTSRDVKRGEEAIRLLQNVSRLPISQSYKKR